MAAAIHSPVIATDRPAAADSRRNPPVLSENQPASRRIDFPVRDKETRPTGAEARPPEGKCRLRSDRTTAPTDPKDRLPLARSFGEDPPRPCIRTRPVDIDSANDSARA